MHSFEQTVARSIRWISRFVSTSARTRYIRCRIPHPLTMYQRSGHSLSSSWSTKTHIGLATVCTRFEWASTKFISGDDISYVLCETLLSRDWQCRLYVSRVQLIFPGNDR